MGFDPTDYELLAGKWRRIRLSAQPQEVRVNEPAMQTILLDGHLQLFVRVRPADERGIAAVTAVLINLQKLPPGHIRDPATYFQSKIPDWSR